MQPAFGMQGTADHMYACEPSPSNPTDHGEMLHQKPHKLTKISHFSKFQNIPQNL